MLEDKREIWLLIDSSSIGGIETHVLELASGLKQSNIPIRVVFMKNYGPHPLINSLADREIPYSIADRKQNRLINLLKLYRPLIIHSHGYKAGIVGRCFAKYMNIKMVSTYHAGEKPVGKVALYDWLDRYSSYFTDYVFAVSSEVATRLPCKAEVIENFIDTSHIKRSLGKQIAFVGRLSHEKGPDTYINIASQCQQFTFHLYGDGPLAEDLKSNSPKNVVFHGFQYDMSTVWSDIGLLLITSHYEGLPMAAIEAMARGIPVLSFNLGALQTLIDHGINGWLVNPGDVSGLIDHLIMWQQLDTPKRIDIQKSAILKVRNSFSSEAIIPKYINRYQKIISLSDKENTSKQVSG